MEHDIIELEIPEVKKFAEVEIDFEIIDEFKNFLQRIHRSRKQLETKIYKSKRIFEKFDPFQDIIQDEFQTCDEIKDEFQICGNPVKFLKKKKFIPVE